MRRQAGFTLIEIMVVVAIVAILSSIAIPSYTDYLRRGRITEAVSGLSETRVRMEQFFQDNRTYVGACAAGTVAPLPPNTPSFAFTCPVLTQNTFTILATGQASMLGFGYTINQANQRVTTAFRDANAAVVFPVNCWVLKKDGSC
jgi:type IV pilus assembly protein PilE